MNRRAALNRRTLLGGVGSVGSLAVIGYASRERGDRLRVRFWRSERAARYPSVPDRIRDLLTVALDLPYWSLEITDGGIVSIGTENPAEAIRRGRWPAALLTGAAGSGDAPPVPDVNLLVSDAPMDAAPTGYGAPHVAAVGGARRLADLDSVGQRPVPVARETFAAQVLVHEVGHGLGLQHAHGEAYRRGDAVVVTPMLSAYAWDPTYEDDRSQCGRAYPDGIADGSLDRQFTYRFSPCARRRLRRYDGHHLP